MSPLSARLKNTTADLLKPHPGSPQGLRKLRLGWRISYSQPDDTGAQVASWAPPPESPYKLTCLLCGCEIMGGALGYQYQRDLANEHALEDHGLTRRARDRSLSYSHPETMSSLLRLADGRVWLALDFIGHKD